MSKKVNGSYRNLTTLEALESRQMFTAVLGLPIALPPASPTAHAIQAAAANGVAAGGTLPTCTLNVQVATSASSIITTTFTPVSSDLDDSAVPAFSTVVTVAT